MTDSLVVSQALTLIDGLTERLSGPASHVYQLALRQVYVDFIMDIVIAALCALTCTIVWKRVRSENLFDEELLALLRWTICLVLALAALSTLLCATRAVLNPEYAALLSLLGR